MIREEIYVLERLLAFNLLKSLETIFKKKKTATRIYQIEWPRGLSCHKVYGSLDLSA